MTSPGNSPLTRLAQHHARRLQVLVGTAVAVFVLLSQVSLPAVDAFDDWTGLDLTMTLIIIPVLAGISGYISWSAIWIVLGGGRWIVRVLFSFAVYHLAAGVGVVIVFMAEYLRDGYMSGFWRRELFGLYAAISYGFSGSLACSMFVVWLMKLCRYRLLYFHSPGDYPASRTVAREIPIDQRPETTVLAGRVYLADMFALTTLFAFYLGGWYPIAHVALDDGQMFGSSFLFAIVLYGLAINGALGLLVMLFPLLMGMLDHRGSSFQIVINTLVITSGCAVAGWFVDYNEYIPESIAFAVTSVAMVLLYQAMLYRALRSPSRLFRFRLVRHQRQ